MTRQRLRIWAIEQATRDRSVIGQTSAAEAADIVAAAGVLFDWVNSATPRWNDVFLPIRAVCRSARLRLLSMFALSVAHKRRSCRFPSSSDAGTIAAEGEAVTELSPARLAA